MSTESAEAGAPAGAGPRARLVASVAEEVIERAELDELLARSGAERLLCYDGFEPSGRIHIAQGLLKAINTNRLLSAGVDCVFYVADWFAYMNNKCGKDLGKIKTLGRYFIEVWRASGMRGLGEGAEAPDAPEGAPAAPPAETASQAETDPSAQPAPRHGKVSFVWASDFIRENAERYWTRAMDVARQNTVPRMQRCSTIMGRDAGDAQPISQVLYPAMQATDVFELGVDLVEMGLDQRKVNVLAREYADHSAAAGAQYAVARKPVILMHHMLKGLVGPKMSKSVKGSAIFMDDGPAEVFAKIWAAKCAPGDRESAILEYYRYIVFPAGAEGLLARCGYPWPEIGIRGPTGAELAAAGAAASAEAAGEAGPSGEAPQGQSFEELFAAVQREGVSVASLRRGAEGAGAGASADASAAAGAPDTPALFSAYPDLENAAAAGSVSPEQLKASLVDYLQALISPVARHFASSLELSRLLEEVREIRQTR